MDTRTPPIPLKLPQEKPQAKRAERAADVSLPPLTPQPRTAQHRRRPYRVLHLGATPLMHACQQGNRARVLRLLKEQEATIGYRDRTLRSALHYCMDAATGGAVAATAPELVNAPDAEGHTPLHLAVIAGDTQLVAVLLANGADVNAKDLEGHSVLHWATVCGEAECVRLVLAAGARPSAGDLRGGSPLHYAAQCCGAAATAELAVPKKVGLKVLQTLLEFGASVNAKDEDGRQPILWAASAGSVEAVLALARAGGAAAAGTSDKDGLTALHCAASRGHTRCVEALVNLCGSQPDHVDDNGCSALHYAATLGHADATALILKLGADPNRQDRKGRTPALCAAAKGQLETLKILAQHGGSLHARTVRGTGIGHEAVASGRMELIKWLARKRPSTMDVATQDGKSPLHVAALHGHLDACKLLLDRGVRINAVLRTSKGGTMTPLDAALYRGHRDCAKLIQMHGGTTAQQLGARKVVLNKAKSRTRRSESSTASDGSLSPRRSSRGHPELYYEERWIERRTRRKGNLRKLARRDSRSFSEEEIRLSRTRKDQKRARSESARYDRNGEHQRRKRSRGRSTRRKHEYSDSSVESDRSSHPRRRRHAAKEASDDEAKVGDSSRREDDGHSGSDDSLEVIVVKKSLEKKCEKVVSGRRSRTPRESSTKETKLTKTRKRSSKRASRSSRSRTSGNEGANATTDRDESPVKEERNVRIEEHSVGRTGRREASDKPAEESEDETEGDEKIESRMAGSRFGVDGTDSTSQETVERVVVTAMVHKDQIPDTPKSTLVPSLPGTEEDIRPSNLPFPESETRDSSKNKEEETEMTIAADDGSEGRSRMRENVCEERETTEEEPSDKSSNPSVSERKLTRDSVAREEDVPDGGGKMEGELAILEEGKEPSFLEEAMKRNASPDEERGRLSAEENVRPDEVDATPSSKRTDETEDSRETMEVTPKQTSETLDPSENATSREHDAETLRERDKKERAEALKSAEQSSKVRGTPSPERTSREEKRSDEEVEKVATTGSKNRRRSDESCSPKSIKARRSRPSTGRNARAGRCASKTSAKTRRHSSSEEHSPDRSAIVAVIDGPAWDEDETVEKEIRKTLGKDSKRDTEREDDEIGVTRVLPSTSEEELAHALSTPSTGLLVSGTSGLDSLPRVPSAIGNRLVRIENAEEGERGEGRPWRKQRRDSGGRDSGIEPSPRVSRIPRRRNARCCPNTAKQQALNMETVTRDVQISLRRYHLERKIFFQLMELKRLQIRHGRANEHVLVKRQVDAFHKSGMTGPTLGVVKYDRPLTFRQFEAFLYEQLRRLQGKLAAPDFCTEAKQCTQKTHRCHHATSAYTSVPVYTYLAGGGPDRADRLPKIESRGRGHMTVEVTHGEERQVIALPTERLDRAKRYFVAFTVKGEARDVEELGSATRATRRDANSV